MPEDLAFHQQLMLEFVKSQYGAVVLGVLTFPILGISIAALIAQVWKCYLASSPMQLRKRLKIKSITAIISINFPCHGSSSDRRHSRRRSSTKVKELKLGERVLSFKWILGMFG